MNEIRTTGRTKGQYPDTATPTARDGGNAPTRTVMLTRAGKLRTGYYRRGRYGNTWSEKPMSRANFGASDQAQGSLGMMFAMLMATLGLGLLAGLLACAGPAGIAAIIFAAFITVMFGLKARKEGWFKRDEKGALGLAETLGAMVILGFFSLGFYLGQNSVGFKGFTPYVIFALAGLLIPYLVMQRKRVKFALTLVPAIPPPKPAVEAPKPEIVKDDKAVSPVIAVILMVAITVVLAATVFVLVSDIGPDAPELTFQPDYQNGTLEVVTNPGFHKWAQLDIQGCEYVPTGQVYVGDELRACQGRVVVRDRPTNVILHDDLFPE